MRQWKKIVVPLTEEDLAMAETNKLEIELEQVKRRWQTNIQVLFVIRENQTLAKSKRTGSPYLDWTTLDTNVERKRKWVEIDLIDTDSERVKTSKQELLEALLEQEGLC